MPAAGTPATAPTAPTAHAPAPAPAPAPADASPPAGRYRWAVLGIATFTQAASCFFVQGIGAMGVPLQRDLDLSTAQLGLLLSAAQFVPLAGLLVAGELLDRYNERWVVGIGACVVAAALAAGSLAQGFGSLLLVLLVVGAGYSTAQPGGSKSVASWFAPSRRGFAMGVRQAGLPLGGALAAAVLPRLADTYGLWAAFAAGGLVALLGAGVFMGCYRPPPAVDALGGPDGRDGRGTPGTRGTPGIPGTPAGKGPDVPLAEQLGDRVRMLREPAMVTVVLSGMSLISVQCGIGVLTALYLHDTTSLGPGPTAVVLVAVQGAGVAGRICLAAWSDRSRSGRYTPVLACMAAVVVGLAALLTPLGRSPLAACVLFTWLGFFGIGWYGPWVAHVAESAPPGRTGSALGLVMAVTQLAVILAPPAIGLLKDSADGFAPVWGVLAAATALALTVGVRGERRQRRTVTTP
ncbi:MFS transporter [Streptomyces sp. CB01881]|nr:MFS transporter [Streptomyces sp. CB01881]TYC72068.1 MFS transporter [Streptomyces sp. CB01881]